MTDPLVGKEMKPGDRAGAIHLFGEGQADGGQVPEADHSRIGGHRLEPGFRDIDGPARRRLHHGAGRGQDKARRQRGGERQASSLFPLIPAPFYPDIEPLTDECGHDGTLGVHPVLGLVEHHGMGPVHDLVRDLLAPVGGQAVQNDVTRIRTGQ